MLSSVEHEGGGVHRGVDLIIVVKLGYRQPFIPIILALIYKESQELLNFLIDPLCLTIGLRVVSGGCRDPDFQQLAEAACEIQNMNWVPQSLMTSSGSPWCFQTWSLNN